MCATPRTTSWWRRRGPDRAAVPGLREIEASGATATCHLHEGRPAAAADARWRAGRCRDGAGGASAGGEAVVIEADGHVLAASPNRSEWRSARRSAARAWSRSVGRRATRRDATATSTSSNWTTARRAVTSSLVATGRRPRVSGIGLESVGIEHDPHGIPVDVCLRAGDAMGDRRRGLASGRSPTSVSTRRRGGDQHPRATTGSATTRRCPRVIYTDPQAAAVGAPTSA